MRPHNLNMTSQNRLNIKLIALVFIYCSALSIYAQDQRPILDSAYLAKEINAFYELIDQPSPTPIVEFGVFGGINRSLFNTEGFYNYSSNMIEGETAGSVGLLVGANMRYIFKKRLRIGVGIEYSQTKNKNSYQDFNSGAFGTSISETLRYIDIPITLTYAFKIGHVVQPYVLSGFSYSMLMNSEVSAIRRGTITFQDTFHNSSYRKETLVSAVFGFGVNYCLLEGIVFSEFRYVHGLSKITDANNRYDTAELLHRYNYVEPSTNFGRIDLRVGYRFQISGRSVR